MSRPCWLSRIGAVDDPCDYSPRYIADAAHIGFTEHFLFRAPTGPKLTKEQANDPALLRDCCRKHHHIMDFGRLDLTRAQIPESVERFANEYGLAWKLDRDYGPRLDKS